MQKYMTSDERTAFFDALASTYPNPQCELNYTSHFTLLVAIILSAQSTDKGVNKVTAGLFPVADTPKAIVDLGLDQLKIYLKSINYFNNKAKSIYHLSQVLLDQYHGSVPLDFDTLVTLPGVGRKTANVFLNVACQAPRLGVDTHVFRLCHRLKICSGKTPTEIEKKLEKLIPEHHKKNACLALVLHGRYICKALHPKCAECPLIHACPADIKNTSVSQTSQKQKQHLKRGKNVSKQQALQK